MNHVRIPSWPPRACRGKSQWFVASVIGAMLAAGGCRSAIRNGDADLPNFQRVTDTLYRGGQPSRQGLERLKEAGVRTVVNLRQDDTDRSRLAGLDFNYERRPMSPWNARDADVMWFLNIATDPARAPVFIHCQHGSDRTGYLIAMYRVVVEGWDRERAIAEMTADGNGFHPLCQNLVRYVRKADVAQMRSQLPGAALVQKPHELEFSR